MTRMKKIISYRYVPFQMILDIQVSLLWWRRLCEDWDHLVRLQLWTPNGMPQKRNVSLMELVQVTDKLEIRRTIKNGKAPFLKLPPTQTSGLSFLWLNFNHLLLYFIPGKVFGKNFNVLYDRSQNWTPISTFFKVLHTYCLKVNTYLVMPRSYCSAPIPPGVRRKM